MYCPECGMQALTNAKFCHDCGQDLRAISLFTGSGGSHVSGNSSSSQPDSNSDDYNSSCGAFFLIVAFIAAVWYGLS